MLFYTSKKEVFVFCKEGHDWNFIWKMISDTEKLGTFDIAHNVYIETNPKKGSDINTLYWWLNE